MMSNKRNEIKKNQQEPNSDKVSIAQCVNSICETFTVPATWYANNAYGKNFNINFIYTNNLHTILLGTCFLQCTGIPNLNTQKISRWKVHRQF